MYIQRFEEHLRKAPFLWRISVEGTLILMESPKDTVDSRFHEPLRETKIGLKNRVLREVGSKIIMFDFQLGGSKKWWFEKSRLMHGRLQEFSKVSKSLYCVSGLWVQSSFSFYFFLVGGGRLSNFQEIKSCTGKNCMLKKLVQGRLWGEHRANALYRSQRAQSIQPKFPGWGSKISWCRMDRDRSERSRSIPLAKRVSRSFTAL